MVPAFASGFGAWQTGPSLAAGGRGHHHRARTASHQTTCFAAFTLAGAEPLQHTAAPRSRLRPSASDVVPPSSHPTAGMEGHDASGVDAGAECVRGWLDRSRGGRWSSKKFTFNLSPPRALVGLLGTDGGSTWGGDCTECVSVWARGEAEPVSDL